MERSIHQKVLKVISILEIILGVLYIVIGVMAIASGSVIGISAEEFEAVAGFVVALFGIIFIFSGIIALIVGGFGLKGAKDPSKIGVFYVFSILGAVCAVLSLIASLTTGDMGTILGSASSCILPGVCVYLAISIKKQNKAS